MTPFLGLTRDNNLRPDLTLEKLASLKPAFEKSAKGTLTAGNSTPLTDGASLVLLGSEEWAKERGLPILAYLRDGEAAAVDFVNGAEGLLMAPVYAVPRLLARNGLTLQDFDYYEIHEAFAAQVLCTLKAWEDPRLLQNPPGPRRAAGLHRPQPAQRQRQLTGGRASVCRHGRAHRRQPGEVAGRGGQGPRLDLDLRRWRSGCHRDHRALNSLNGTCRSELAAMVCQLTGVSTDTPLSRASSLPQGSPILNTWMTWPNVGLISHLAT